MPSLWPFRTGNDEFYQSEQQKETIYDALGTLPEFTYTQELTRHDQWRWRRGIIQSVLPAATAGIVIGFCLGFRQSRVEGRYLGRWRVLTRYTTTGGLAGVICSSIHHMLVLRNAYEERLYYPMLSGMCGSTLITVATQTGTISVGVVAGAFVGTMYSCACFAARWYRKRQMKNFLEGQRQMQVPVHKLSPELQPMYRAYLFDNRPIEEHSDARRRAIVLARTENDYRLDAETFLATLTPDVYDWVNFPDWWPFKHPFQTEEQTLLIQRQRDEEIQRRTNIFLNVDDGIALKRKHRGALHRDQ